MTETRNIKIAVVDDHPIVVAGLQATLASQANIEVVQSASSLANLIDQAPVQADILLLDLNIPGESYLENFGIAKARWPETRVAAYTSYNYPDLIRETLRLGFCGFLLKQVSREALVDGLFAIYEGERHVSVEQRSTASAGAARKPRKGDSPNDDFQKRLLLSKREKEILHHISKGSTSQQIADELFISRYTVETHRKNILRKLNFNTSTELVKFAVEQGLV